MPKKKLDKHINQWEKIEKRIDKWCQYQLVNHTF